MSGLQPCGTYGGYQRHKRAGEDACVPCRAANAAYGRRRRQEDPNVVQNDLRHRKVRGRALTRLADRHHEEYRRLLNEEWDKLDDQ